MNWKDLPATESGPIAIDRQSVRRQFASLPGAAHESGLATAHPKGGLPEVKIDKKPRLQLTGKEAIRLEVFTLTVDGETIELVPAKTWSQLDHYKWTVRGKLPAEPAGLEIAADQVRMTGESVLLADPAACVKLERLFKSWLLFESENLQLACKKAHFQAPPVLPEEPEEPTSLGNVFRVEIDKRGQVHVHCVHGRETLATIGLTVAGFTSLYQQGLIRHPRSLKAGALHDWVELDGYLYSFENGRNDAARLEQTLNERFAPAARSGLVMEVTISLNVASATGFDIQFPVIVGGRAERQRHHLDEQALELLQDPDRCGLLHKEVLVKLMAPYLVLKQRTPDGGEQPLPWGPESVITLTDEEGRPATLRLNQPLNLLRLSAAELTAVFNHPSINRHTRIAQEPCKTQDFQPVSGEDALELAEKTSCMLQPGTQLQEIGCAEASELEAQAGTSALGSLADKPEHAQTGTGPMPTKSPNLWLRDILSKPALQHDWFACLVYTKIAEWFGNSTEGKFGPATCWFISMGEVEEITAPLFKGVFLTEKGSIGFLHQGQVARFYNRLAFLGSQKAPLEGTEVELLALGLDGKKRVVFVVSDNYRGQFGVPAGVLTTVLNRLNEHGVVVGSVQELLDSAEPLTIVWTVPAEQADPNNPQAVQSVRAEAVVT